jgi:2-polyprenyl-6-methoxyphenol hydroxylase-like FAD-dependent oxidoreductase
LGQDRFQGILREHLKKYGCEVEFGTKLQSLEQFDNDVVAHLIKIEGETEVNEDVRVQYLVGADGGRSELTFISMIYGRDYNH